MRWANLIGFNVSPYISVADRTTEIMDCIRSRLPFRESLKRCSVLHRANRSQRQSVLEILGQFTRHVLQGLHGVEVWV